MRAVIMSPLAIRGAFLISSGVPVLLGSRFDRCILSDASVYTAKKSMFPYHDLFWKRQKNVMFTAGIMLYYTSRKYDV